MNAPSSCSASSLEAHEPLAGTAVSNTRYWLGLEVRTPWAPHAVEDADLPPAARAVVDAFAVRPGARVQLLRRPERQGSLRVVFVDATPGAERRYVFALDGLDGLAALDLDGLVAGTAHMDSRTDGPEVWVCTHGTRDACCGLQGGQVFVALRAVLGDAVWQTSHLGGHRFAPTLLWLPHGLSLGRVRPEEAPALARAAAQGDLYDTERLRGRCAWPPAVQAAEAVLRRRTGWTALGAPRVLDVEPGEVVTVRFEADGREHAVSVRQQALPDPVVPSCGKPPGPGKGWFAVS